ncbi:MAG: hypothetical protein R2867_05110 [Caldilineaceae bacterium]
MDLTAAAQGQLDYVAPQKPRWESVGAVREKPVGERLKALADTDDRAGELIWHTLSNTMAYASKRVPEIGDSLADIDNAMKWGFACSTAPLRRGTFLASPPRSRAWKAKGWPWRRGLRRCSPPTMRASTPTTV